MRPQFESEGERQMSMLRALDKVKAVIVRTLEESLPDVEPARLRRAGLGVMVAIVDQGEVEVYLKTGDTGDRT